MEAPGSIVIWSILVVILAGSSSSFSFLSSQAQKNNGFYKINRPNNLEKPKFKGNGTNSLNLVQLAQKLNLTKFVEALTQTGLSHILNHEGPYTVFAPNDRAFERAPSYCQNVPLLDRMQYHTTRNLHPIESLKNDEELWSLLSHRYVRANVYGETKAVTASGRQIVLANQVAYNGIIHVIEDEICSIYKGGAMFEINRCPDLSQFTAGVKLSKLFAALDVKDPITIFAPTNEAVESLDPVVKRKLLANVTLLSSVILNHVLTETVYKAGMYDGQNVKTVAGYKLSVSVKNNIVKLNGQAKVVLADATVKNGVVHSIDAVLIPKFLMKYLV